MRNTLMLLSAAGLLLSSYVFGSGYKEDMKNYTVIEKRSMTIIGISCRTSHETAHQDIPLLWGRFYSENISSKIPNKASDEVIGLYCDYEGDYTKPYSLVIGCPVNFVDDIPEGMVSKTIPEGNYANFEAKGKHPDALIETWGKVWADGSLKRTYTGDYELYDESFLGSPQEVSVFIAVE